MIPNISIILIYFLAPLCLAMAPLVIEGRRFVDSETKKPFIIKGVDYQPGGSSGYFGRSDPLSDLNSCSRDIFLFQQLGLNTIRVYTINPDLIHDECMTLLAAAGMYLILDVNSPRVGESLHRYEPWTTFNQDYFEHIFKVVHQFSSYNNTLGFFAGNEVINDETSAMSSPRFVKAVVRDLKHYMRENGLRQVPIGYSAADDLRYRMSLAKYLECGDSSVSVDFYGVNSYQWCGTQTFVSSGYDILINDYREYSLPLFLSEYGCNAVTPRIFQEVSAIYGTAMLTVFSGGLVYEFTQGPNNYGLVEMDQNGNVYIGQDFDTLKQALSQTVTDTNLPSMQAIKRPGYCLDHYDNLFIGNKLPDPVALELSHRGLNNPKVGKYLQNLSQDATTHYIFDYNEREVTDKRVRFTDDWKAHMKKGVQWRNSAGDKTPSKSDRPWFKSGSGFARENGGTTSLFSKHRGGSGDEDQEDTSSAGTQAHDRFNWQVWLVQGLVSYCLLAAAWFFFNP